MKRTLIALALGLACGLAAHFSWFAAHRPPAVDDLDSELRWMKRDLQLDDAQLARIRTLHEQSGPRLLALANEVSQLRRELAVFEQARATDGNVDFVGFARFVEKQRALDRECLDSSRRLVAATAEVLTPRQREQYYQLLSPAYAQPAERPRI